MFELVQSLAALVAAFASNAARRALGTFIGLFCALGLCATSAFFFTMAGYRALDRAIGEIYAPAAMGAAYLVMTLITLLIVQGRRLR